MIDRLIVRSLKQIVDDRGRVMHMIRSDSPFFEQFGEVYFSEILPSVVKAWKRHKSVTQLFAVPVGMIKLAIYDDRENSNTKGDLEVLEIGRENYQLVKIPPKLWYGFKCISDYPSLVANCPSLPHNQNESETISSNDKSIPYQW